MREVMNKATEALRGRGVGDYVVVRDHRNGICFAVNVRDAKGHVVTQLFAATNYIKSEVVQ